MSRQVVFGIIALLGSSVVSLGLAEIGCALLMPSTMVVNDILGRRLIIDELKFGDAGGCRDLAPGTAGSNFIHGIFRYDFAVDDLGTRIAKAGGGSSAGDGQAPVLLLLGDSQTFGVGLNHEATYAAKLERLLAGERRAWRVVNAGVPGYSTHHELCKLRRLAPTLRPRLVLVAFFGDNALVQTPGSDLFGNFNSGRTTASDTSQKMTPAVAVPQPKFALLTRSSHLYAAVASVWQRLRGDRTYEEQVAAYVVRRESDPALPQAWERTRELLRAIAGEAARFEGRAAVVYLPGVPSLELDDRSVEGELARAGLPVVSVFVPLREAWRERRPILYSEGHFTDEGTSLIANEIAAGIARSGLLASTEKRKIPAP